MEISLDTFCKNFANTNVKFSPVTYFINVKRTIFLYERHFSSFYYVHVTRKKLPKWRWYKKFARLTLMKLTPGFTFRLWYLERQKLMKLKQSILKQLWSVSCKIKNMFRYQYFRLANFRCQFHQRFTPAFFTKAETFGLETFWQKNCA